MLSPEAGFVYLQCHNAVSPFTGPNHHGNTLLLFSEEILVQVSTKGPINSLENVIIIFRSQRDEPSRNFPPVSIRAFVCVSWVSFWNIKLLQHRLKTTH